MPQFEDADGRAITRENAPNGWNEALNQPLFGYEELDKPFPIESVNAVSVRPGPNSRRWAATNKRCAADGKIHKVPARRNRFPSRGLGRPLPANGAVISELTNKSWHLESVPCADPIETEVVCRERQRA